jgi:spermidine/putrescine transport system substrate-binding protein
MRRLSTLVLLMGILLLMGCGGRKLYIYNWTYYIPEAVVKQFEQKYMCKVVYDVYSSNEEMFAKLKAGGRGYDVVFPSGDFTKIMIHEGMLQKLDKNKLPNIKYLDKRILSKINFDQGNVFSVPYMAGTAGIAVNTKFVKDYDHSSTIFDRSDLKGKMTLLDDMREVLGMALKRLGFSVNSTDPTELEQAKAVALRWKQNILKFDAESFAKGFAAGEYWVVQGYAENVFLELDEEQRKSVDFFIPKEGTTMYIDSMVILKDAPHMDLAYAFVNYVHQPEVYAQIADYLQLPAINTGATGLIKRSPHYKIEDLDKCQLKEDLGSGVQTFNQAWESIRM